MMGKQECTKDLKSRHILCLRLIKAYTIVAWDSSESQKCVIFADLSDFFQKGNLWLLKSLGVISSQH